MTIRDFASHTTRNLHVYADGTSGDDANDGLTVSTPKQTLQKAIDLVPDILAHHVTVHATGTFTNQGEVNIAKNILDKNKRLVIDGGGSYTTKPTDGGPYTSDADSTSVEYIEVTGAGWTVNSFQGWMVEIPNGSGTAYNIQSNTADRIYVAKYLSSSLPSTDFRVVKPATVYTSTSGGIRLWGMGGGGQLSLQRLSIEGAANLWSFRCTCFIRISSVLVNSTAPFAIYYKHVNNSYIGYSGIIDPDSWGESSVNNFGVSALQGSTAVIGCEAVHLYNGVHGSIFASKSGCSIGYGSLVKRCYWFQVGQSFETESALNNIESASGYAKAVFGPSADSGLVAKESVVRIGSSVDFSGNTAHGIDAEGSTVAFSATTTGSGNGGAGIYAHSGSQVTIKDGSPPTLTGTVGDVAVTDPESEDTTWADVDAGNPLQIAAESTAIREVA